MKIKIIDAADDGEFIVGNVYNVAYNSGMFVYAIDENGDTEVVYAYQFVVVEA